MSLTLATQSAMTTDKTQIKFYALRDDLRDAIKRAAFDDQRSSSVFIERVLVDWLIDHGYLAKSLPKPKAARK
jgi:hypothetical protein